MRNPALLIILFFATRQFRLEKQMETYWNAGNLVFNTRCCVFFL